MIFFSSQEKTAAIYANHININFLKSVEAIWILYDYPRRKIALEKICSVVNSFKYRLLHCIEKSDYNKEKISREIAGYKRAIGNIGLMQFKKDVIFKKNFSVNSVKYYYDIAILENQLKFSEINDIESIIFSEKIFKLNLMDNYIEKQNFNFKEGQIFGEEKFYDISTFSGNLLNGGRFLSFVGESKYIKKIIGLPEVSNLKIENLSEKISAQIISFLPIRIVLDKLENPD